MLAELNLSQELSAWMQKAAAAGLILAALGTAGYILLYVLQGVGLFTIAKKRKLCRPWLSWIPAANLWVLGCAADHYQRVNRNCERKNGRILLWLRLGTLTADLLMLGILAAVCWRVAQGLLGVSLQSGAQIWSLVSERLDSLPAALQTGAVGVEVLMLALHLCLFVCRLIACRDVYASCNPDTKTYFFILSVLFPVLIPFFLFVDRKKDYGMPPRRE